MSGLINQIINDLEYSGYKCEKKILHDISFAGKIVATIYPEDKYIQFHDEYTQISYDIPKLRKIIDVLEAEGFEHNHT